MGHAAASPRAQMVSIHANERAKTSEASEHMIGDGM